MLTFLVPAASIESIVGLLCKLQLSDCLSKLCLAFLFLPELAWSEVVELAQKSLSGNETNILGFILPLVDFLIIIFYN